MKKLIQLKTADGLCEAYEIHADGEKPRPGVLLLMDAIGVREALLELAERIAGEGFFVLVPNIFYRDHHLPLTNYPQKFTKEELGPLFGKVKAYMEHLTPEKIQEDGSAYVNHLKKHPLVEKGKLSTVGYCFGARFAIRTAAKFPQDFKAAVSLHGGNLVTETPDSPHLLLERINARFFFGHADHDSSMPADKIKILEETLKSHHKDFKSHIYPHAPHGYTQTDLPAYQEKAAEEAFREMMGLFKS